MNRQELKQTMTKPQLARLKALGTGMHVGHVLGNRVLVAPIKPYTDLDRVEKEGLLVIPQATREANTPKESTGIVVAVGDDAFHPALEEGVAVMFGKHSGFEILVDEEEFRIIDVPDILCTIDFDDPSVVVPVKVEE